jgi:hypothetical protein
MPRLRTGCFEGPVPWLYYISYHIGKAVVWIISTLAILSPIMMAVIAWKLLTS